MVNRLGRLAFLRLAEQYNAVANLAAIKSELENDGHAHLISKKKLERKKIMMQAGLRN